MKALLAAGLALGLGLGGLGGLASAPRDAASAAVAAQAAPRSGIVRLAIDRVESPSFEGRAFGQVGPYEKLVGRAFGEVDPDDPANADLALLDRAPRNARGLVEYDVDVYILKPVDVERGNHTLLYDVVNRGNKPLWGALNVDAGGANDPTTAADAGDGLSLRQGYTWVWSGWQGDAPPGAGRLVARFPVAVDADGSTIRQQIRTEFVLGAPAYSVPVSYDNGLRDGRSYPAVEASMDTATLSRRAGAGAEPELIPREEWSFAACADGATATPSATDVCLPAGFSPSYVYDLVYEAQDPPVMGLGFVATRDLIAFLRHDTSDANPLVQQVGRNPIQWTIGFGSSQSGRFLKDLIYQGFNQDPAGRRVFDGAAINISGGRRGFFNYPFAMPGRFSTGVEGHHYPGDQFPFSYVTLTDPISGERDSLLARCRAQGACPRVMHWDSGTEAWQGRHSLVVTPRRRAHLLLRQRAARAGHAGARRGDLPAAGEPTERAGEPAGADDGAAKLGGDWRRAAAEPIRAHRRRHAGAAAAPGRSGIPHHPGRALHGAAESPVRERSERAAAAPRARHRVRGARAEGERGRQRRRRRA